MLYLRSFKKLPTRRAVPFPGIQELSGQSLARFCCKDHEIRCYQTIDVQNGVRYNQAVNVQINVHRGGFNMSIMNATTARNNFFKVMDEAIITHEPICITGKNGNVIIVSEEDWMAMQETLYLSSIPGMREKIIKGLNTPLDECVEDSRQ